MAKKTPSGADSVRALYTVLEPLRVDGMDYAVGDVVELGAEEASALLAAKVIAAPAPELTVSAD